MEKALNERDLMAARKVIFEAKLKMIEAAMNIPPENPLTKQASMNAWDSVGELDGTLKKIDLKLNEIRGL